jgi:tRNA U34 5-methylaminomethyl-2-thiouridine-forming methyltransferase MnmC
VDVNDLFQGYMGLIHTHPLLTKCATSACIVPLGDLSAQAIETWKAKKAALAEGKLEEDLENIDIDSQLAQCVARSAPPPHPRCRDAKFSARLLMEQADKYIT